MHVVISWDIKEDGEERERLNKELKACFESCSWVKPLTTFYIVKIKSIDQREEIKDCLVDVCKANPGKVNLLIGPATESGSYGGWLPKDLWPKVKKRTQGAA